MQNMNPAPSDRENGSYNYGSEGLKFESSRVRIPTARAVSPGNGGNSNPHPAPLNTGSQPLFKQNCCGFAKPKKSCGGRKNTLAGSRKGNTRGYVRNAGHRNFYRRGRVYYRVRYGVWVSLRTTDRSEALKRLRALEAQELMARSMEKLGLVARLNALEEKVSRIEAPSKGEIPLAPWTAINERGDFETELEKFLSRMPTVAKGTKLMWRTAKNNLIKLFSNLKSFEGREFTGDHWEKFEALTPTGVWNAFRAQKKAMRGKNAFGAAPDEKTGNSSANHMACFLRRFVPNFVERGFLPPFFVADAQRIPKLVVHRRDPKIPSPVEMEEFLRACERRDWEIGQLLRFLAYSGARKGTVFDRERAVRWDQVDFEAGDIVFWQKGDVRRRVPMGPQLRDVLSRWKISCPADATDPRVFPFGSGREDRALEILKEVARNLGGSVSDMTMFHILKHFFKTQHQRQGTPDEVSDFLTFNSPSARGGSGNTYRHDAYTQARHWVQRVKL